MKSALFLLNLRFDYRPNSSLQYPGVDFPREEPEKCEFHSAKVSFLGFVIVQGRLQPDSAKILAIEEWPTPTTWKQLQRFLGLANFYRRFIRDYSCVAAPLTQLTSPVSPFTWSAGADLALNKLKTLFTHAPILLHPDQARQFVVEVDASDSGVGAIVSQRHPTTDKLHHCAFFSRLLSPAERDYDVGNRELLAVVLGLQEWHHWLEGTVEPSIIWTDHKELAYLRAAKKINSRQARWSLFLSRFQFSLSFLPGSRNGKPDTLSRLYSPDATTADPKPVLPSPQIIGAATWEIENTVWEAQARQPDPGTGPPN